MWRTDKPETIGNYIIFVPEIIGPVKEGPQEVSGFVARAWFDGNSFIQATGIQYNVGECAWTPRPDLVLIGSCSQEPVLEVRE